MSKVVTSATVFQTQAGMRLSTTYCEIEDGTITKDNVRVNRILTGPEELAAANALIALAQNYLEG